jgi:DNA-directed RNA polymerase specialized sigma subunit
MRTSNGSCSLGCAWSAHAGSCRALPPRERHALVERVMNGRPANEVAGELQVTPQRVSQLVNQAIRKLRAKCDPTEDHHA